MILSCVAIDDEPLALSLVQSYVEKIPSLQLLQTFDDAIGAGEFLRQHPVNLLFIDVQMPDISGIELVRSLPAPPLLIFTTAHRQFAYEGFELDAVDYLLKPFPFGRFKKAVDKALEIYQHRTAAPAAAASEYLLVRSEYKLVRISLADIDYIEGREDYIRIHLLNSRPVLTLMTLKAVQEKLPPRFRRIHRSYIIPADNIVAVVNKKVTLLSKTELPVSDSYLSFLDEWKNAGR